VVVKYNYSLEGQRVYLFKHMREHRRMPFETLFEACETRIHAIFTFLAMLELIQQNYLAILVGTGRNNFIVEWNELDPALMDAAPVVAEEQSSSPEEQVAEDVQE
jgi:segregation and condensation protein A